MSVPHSSSVPSLFAGDEGTLRSKGLGKKSVSFPRVRLGVRVGSVHTSVSAS